MKYIFVPMYARNVYFEDEAEAFLINLQEKAANANVKKWVTSNLRNYIINKEKLPKLSPAFKRQIAQHPDKFPKWLVEKASTQDIYSVDVGSLLRFSHVVDYLNTLTSNVTNMSVEEAVKQTAKWDADLRKRKEDVSREKKTIAEETGVTVVYRLPNGYSFVSVDSKDALKREGDLMGHCVGGAGYYKQVKSGATKIYSLRDTNNKPHVTIEYNVRNKKIEQIKGKENEPPVKKYRPAVLKFISDNPKLPVHAVDSKDLSEMGWLFDEETSKFIDLATTKDIDVSNFELDYATLYEDLHSITADNVKLRYANFACGRIDASYDVIIEDCCLSIGKIQAENVVLSDEDASGELEIGEIKCDNISVYCSTHTKIIASNCVVENNITDGQSVMVIASGSDIKRLICKSSRIAIEDNVHIEKFESEDEETWPFFSIGKNVTFGNLDCTYAGIDEELILPDNLTVTGTLTFDIYDLPETVGKNVKCHKLLITDCVSQYPAKDSQYQQLKKLLEGGIQYDDAAIDGTLVYEKMRQLAPNVKIREVT